MKIKGGDMALPTCSADGRTGKTIRLGCMTVLDDARKVLLNRLGPALRQRLRRTDHVSQM